MAFDTKSLLILGAKGMLGQEFVRVFSSDKEFSVTAWDRDELNLANEREVREKITELWPDVIVNAAAYNAVDLCEADDAEYEKALVINGYTPGMLADIANDIQATFVHFSTDYVFDGKQPKRGDGADGCCGSGCVSCSYGNPEGLFDGYREGDLPNPISRYGETKLRGEELTRKATENHYIIRLSRLFGVPASIEGAKRSFFDVMLEMARSGKPICAVEDEVASFTYAKDLAEATMRLVSEKSPFGTYHLINEGGVSWYEAAKTLFEITGITVDIEPVSGKVFARPARRPAKSTLINTKFEPLRGWREALIEYVQKSQ
jgi:dTDP-4-dehydrorhamnose reductase